MISDNDDRSEETRRAQESSRDEERGRQAAKRAKKPKDPAKPTRAKANRPDFPPTEPELEKLLNPGIHGGTAGPGPSIGIRPPADNSKDRRADIAAAHTSRASTRGFAETPQAAYQPGETTPLAGIDPELAQALGFDGTDETPSPPSPACGGEPAPDLIRG